MKTNPKLARLIWAYPNNWTQKYNLFCDGAETRDSVKSIVLIENTIFCLLFLSLADVFGRKKILITAGCFIIIGMTMNLMIDNIYFKMIGMGMAAGSEGSFSALFSIMINETTRKNI